mgnify:CR=1 FL=1
MRLGDRVKLSLINNTTVGIITYLDSDKNYGEITTKIFDSTNSSNHTIESEDWFGFEFRKEITNTSELVYGKFLESDTNEANEFKITVIEENLDGDFFTTKYTNIYNKNLESNRLYHVITTKENKEFEPGTIFEIVSVDKESGFITCYNYTARKNQRLFPNKTPIFNEEVTIDVSNGISKKNNNYIIDFCELLEDSDTDSDSDSDTDSDLQVDTTQTFYIKGKIPESDRQLTENQKREKITSSIREMFNDTLSNKDLMILNNHIYNSLHNKYDLEKDWVSRLELFRTGGLIPVLNKPTKEDSNSSDDEDEPEIEKDDTSTDYYTFIENQLKPLVRNDNNESENTLVIKHRTRGIYSKSKENVVLNSAYSYPYANSINNTEDIVHIKEYIVKDTNHILKTLPPSPVIFSNIYKTMGNQIFSHFDTSNVDIHIRYLDKIKLVKDKIPTIQLDTLTITNDDKMYKDINKKTKQVDLENSEVPKLIIDSKSLNKDITKVLEEELKEFVWDDNQVWPRSLVFSRLEDKKKINKEQLCKFINSMEGKDVVNNTDSYIKDYYDNFKGVVNLKASKNKQTITFSGVYKPSTKLYINNEEEILSKTLLMWQQADKIEDRVLRNKRKLEILNSGEYVRNAEFNGESPYYYIDIFTGKSCFPKHVLLQLEAELSSQKNEIKIKKCLFNQWGEEEIGTENIVSIINGDIIGSTTNDYDVIGHSKMSNIQNIPQESYNHLGSDLNVYTKIIKNVFIDGFMKILEKLNAHSQYHRGNVLSIENYKEPSNIFFKNSNEWRTYVSFFSFDENALSSSDIPEKIVKNLSRFSSKLKNTYKALKAYPKSNDMSNEKSKRILRKLEARVISEIKDTKIQFEEQITEIAILYLISYIYSHVTISHEGKMNIILSIFPVNKKTQLTEENILLYSRSEWNYTGELETKYNYSYKSKYGTFKTVKYYKNSSGKMSGIVESIHPIVPNIKSKTTKPIDIPSYILNKPHKLGKQWEKYHKNVLSIKKMEWAEIYDDTISNEEEDVQYKCLVLQVSNILLKSKPNDKFILPKLWSILSEKGQLEKIRGWLSDVHNVSENISSLKNYDEFIEVITDDLIDFRKFVSTNTIISWKNTWLHLVQHLLHEMDTLDLAFPDYRNILELVIKSLIENEETVCGQSIIMTRSIVENVHAIVEEDEAQGHFGINSDKSSQRITREDMKRNLGRYGEGLRTQFDIRTVLDSTENISNNEPQSSDVVDVDTMFDNDYSNNFEDEANDDDI